MTDRAANLDMSPGLLDETIDHAEAEASPLTFLLRREERLEHFLANLRRDASAGVGDGEHDVVPGRDVDILCGVVRIEVLIGHLNYEASTIRHGVASIDGGVGQGRLDLSGIRRCRPQASGGIDK